MNFANEKESLIRFWCSYHLWKEAIAVYTLEFDQKLIILGV